MIGWINNSVEAFIRDSFGEDKWNAILEESGHIKTYPWVSSCPFSDKITYDLVITGARILGVTVDQALEAYGMYFVQYVTNQGYTKLLKCLGSDIIQFLDNLNNLHLHLTMSSPEMQAPAFRCEKVTPESVELHYFSSRPALWPIVVGVLKGLSQEYFKLELIIDLIQSRHEGTGDHEVFLVRFPRQDSVSARLALAGGVTEAAAGAKEASCRWNLSPVEHERMTVDAELFAQLFPFHILMDKSFLVLQVGHVLGRLFPQLSSGVHVAQHFAIKMPRIKFTYADVCRESNGAFLLRSLETGLELKGQMLLRQLPVPGCPVKREVVVFLGSPRCANLDDLQAHGVFLSDIATHDMSGDFVLLAEQRQAEANLKERFEKLTHELKAEKARSDALVQRMSGLINCFPFVSNNMDSGDKSLASSIAGSMTMTGYGAQDRVGVIEAVRRAMGPAARDASEDITLVQAIGEGSFGKVYRGLWQGTEVAIKTIVLPANMSGSEKREKMAIMEAAISSSLSHPNVVQTYTYTIKPLRDSASESAAGSAGINSMKQPSKEPLTNAASNNEQVASLVPEELPSAFVIGGGTEVLDVPGQAPLKDIEDDNLDADGLPSGLFLGGATETHINLPTMASKDEETAKKTATKGKEPSTTSSGSRTRLSSHLARKDRHSAKLSQISGSGLLKTSNSGQGAIHSYEICLVLEFCDLGSLKDVLDQKVFTMPDGTLNYRAILDTAMDIAKAMLHLHKNNVLHADLKARNILMRSAGDSGKGFIAKVADFGLSVKMDNTETHMSDMCQGTLTHMAPELMLEGQMSKSADVYAFGILLWELYTGGTPYLGTPKALLGHQVVAMDKRPIFPEDTPPEFKKLAKWCWSRDAKVRPFFEEIMQTLSQLRMQLGGRTPIAIPAKESEGYSQEMPRELRPPGPPLPPHEGDTPTDDTMPDFGSALVCDKLNTLQ